MTDSEQPRERLVLTCVPALVAVLLRAESDKGGPLTQEEVEAIRDNANVVVMPHFAAEEVARARGYDDINPERAWEEWQSVRRSWIKGEQPSQ